MRETFTHILQSGLTVEFRRMKTYHQDWLSTNASSQGKNRLVQRNKGDGFVKGIEHVIGDCIDKLGEVDFTKITGKDGLAILKAKAEIVEQIFSWDMKELALMMRFFTCDLHFAERMEEHKAWNALSKEEKEEGRCEEFTSELPEHLFKFSLEIESDDDKAMHKFETELYMWDFKMEPGSCTDIDRVEDISASKEHKVKLPIDGRTCLWDMLDVRKENKYAANINDPSFSINTPMVWRNIRIQTLDDDGNPKGAPLTQSKADIGKYEVLDSSALRDDINKHEGSVDSKIAVRDPHNEGKFIDVDIMSTIDFFIPSGAAL